MHESGLEAFDTTLRKTQLWIKEIMHALHFQDRHLAYLALKGVLHSLRDRLPVDEAVQLGAQLPMLVRGLYYEGWRAAGKPLRERHQEAFLMDAMKYFGEGALTALLTPPRTEAADVVRAVLRVLSRHTTEAASLRSLLSADLRALWPEN